MKSCLRKRGFLKIFFILAGGESSRKEIYAVIEFRFGQYPLFKISCCRNLNFISGDGMDSAQRARLAAPVILLAAVVLASILSEAGGSGLVTSSTAGFEPGFLRRNLLQMQNSSNQNTTKSDDTVRVDPLHHFKKYRGGYDIRNKHYWSSTIFTGVYGFAIGLLFLLCGVLYGGYLLIRSMCHKNKGIKLGNRSPCHKQCHLWPIILATTLTILAIVTSGLALGGSTRFHSRAKTIAGIIIDTADEASRTIYNATTEIKAVSEVASNYTSGDYATFLSSKSEELDREAADIARQARKNRRLIQDGLNIVFIVTTVAVSFNLLAVLALQASGALRFRRMLLMLTILCWLLTALCWFFFGTYYFLENFSKDTCTALKDFQQNPENSSLSSILPCNDLESTTPVLRDVSKEIYDLIFQVNANISLLKSSSYPDLEYVCNPFSGPPNYQYQPENCSANTIQIGDIPQVLKMFTCLDTSNGSCKQGEVTITASEFNVIEVFTTAIQSLLDEYPEMEKLVDCQIVKDAFSEILAEHCKPWKRDAKMTWVSMLLLSVIMVALVLVWAARAHHEKARHSSEGSVRPHPTDTGSLES
ncbi:hypothetical protein Nepgr_027933 [Nepenthes gracilis]|uniref:Transmembrane protein n=1 Tax=Nepenthes gracilis TaxID=150966 RepID=A0AAD3T9D7_NEPGR|nr:hypothetical protein Nepgr_027933 [Nepenthes gracilis]